MPFSRPLVHIANSHQSTPFHPSLFSHKVTHLPHQIQLRITPNKDPSLHTRISSQESRAADLGSHLGIEVVLIEGGVEILEREGDALHGGSAAPVVGVLEELLQLGPLPGLGIGDGHRRDDGQRGRLLGRTAGGVGSPASSEGLVGEAGATERRASQAGELLRQRRHLFSGFPARCSNWVLSRAPPLVSFCRDWVRERVLSG